MAWSTAQVARMSGTTSRTLRHYDEIGLLKPASVGGNGYRYYEKEQLLRLQQILVLRELGVGLDAIAEIVRDGRDQVEILRTHHRWLLDERDRFDRLARTVARTIDDVSVDRTGIDQLGKEKKVKVEHWFEGLTPAKQEALVAEARELYGAEAVDAANAKVSGTAADWWKENGAQWTKSLEELIAHIDAGREPGDDAVQDTIAGHHRWLGQFWEANPEAYSGLADTYADEPRFRANFDKSDPRLAEYLRSAMKHYARTRMA